MLKGERFKERGEREGGRKEQTPFDYIMAQILFYYFENSDI